MREVGFEIVKAEESEKNEIKYLNINVSNSEVERNPDIVRLCADVGILEYMKPKTGHWKRISMDLYVQHAASYYKCSECGEKVIGEHNYCQFCGARMEEPQESEDKDADKKCTYKETGCGSCKRQLDCPIEADTSESEDRCKNCEYSHNPDYTRCHECKAESEVRNETDN